MGRSSDPSSIEYRHKRELDKNSRTFFKRKGDQTRYVEKAHGHSDMLVWQSAQARDAATLSPLMTTLGIVIVLPVTFLKCLMPAPPISSRSEMRISPE